MKTYSVYGRKVKAHDANCADGFRTDRRYGAIYGAVQIVSDDDDNGKEVSWETGSLVCDFCVYCGTK